MKSLVRLTFVAVAIMCGLQAAVYSQTVRSGTPISAGPDAVPVSPSDTARQEDSLQIDARQGIKEIDLAADFESVRNELKQMKEPKIRKVWPTGALLRSALVPGWGQLYNRKYIKAVIYGGLEIFLMYEARKNWRQMDAHQTNFLNTDDQDYQAQEFSLYIMSRDDRNLYLWFTGFTIFISMFDAFVDAHLANFDQTDKAFEVFIAPDDGLVNVGFTCKF